MVAPFGQPLLRRPHLGQPFEPPPARLPGARRRAPAGVFTASAGQNARGRQGNRPNLCREPSCSPIRAADVGPNGLRPPEHIDKEVLMKKFHFYRAIVAASAIAALVVASGAGYKF